MRLALAAFAAFLLLASLSVSARSTDADYGASGGCGVERVHIKEMDDAGAARVSHTAQSATVDELRALPVPQGYSKQNDSTRYAPELNLYDVHALLIGWKLEADKDYHLVIAQPDSPSHTMIVESIDPSCPGAKASEYENAYAAVRAAFAKCNAAPTPRFKKFNPPIDIEIEGPGFFDPLHGQTGVAPNGFEIHPILAVKSLSCPR